MTSLGRLYLVLWPLIGVLSLPLWLNGSKYAIEAWERARRPKCINSLKPLDLAVKTAQPRRPVGSRLFTTLLRTIDDGLRITDEFSYARFSHR